MGLSQIDEYSAISWRITFDHSAPINTPFGTLAGQAPRARIDVMLGSNSDTIDHFVGFSTENSTDGTFYVAKLPAGAGMGTVAGVDILAAMLPAAQQQLLLDGTSSTDIWVYIAETVAAGKIVNVTAFGGLV